MASGDMISVDIDFTSFQGGIKKQTFKGVRIPQSCCIRDLKDHLKLSKGITGRISVNEKELSNNKTLNVLGIVTDTVLDMKSFTPAKQYTHSILVKRVNGTVISVQVHSGTTTGGLKHILQDKIGMPVEEQVLEYDDGMIVQDKKRVVEICVHKKQIVLKSRKDTIKSKEIGSQSSTVKTTVSRTQKIADEDSVDGPCAKRKCQTHAQEVPMKHAGNEDSVDVPCAKRKCQTPTQEVSLNQADESKLSSPRENGRPNSADSRSITAARPLKHADEDSVDGPCAKRKCQTHAQEVPMKHADGDKLLHSRERGKQHSAVNKSKAATQPPKHAQPDLAKLAQLPVAPDWWILGIQLGVPPHRLNIIQCNNAHSPEGPIRCLVNMFDWWLNNSCDSTYEKLAAALKAIGKTNLALKVCSGSNEDTSDSSPKIKHQAHEQDVYHSITDGDLIELAPDTSPSETEFENVVLKIITDSLADCLGHERKTETTFKINQRRCFGTQKIEILLECTQKNGNKATWKALVKSSLKAGDRELAEKIIAESRNSSPLTRSFAENSSLSTRSHAAQSSPLLVRSLAKNQSLSVRSHTEPPKLLRPHSSPLFRSHTEPPKLLRPHSSPLFR